MRFQRIREIPYLSSMNENHDSNVEQMLSEDEILIAHHGRDKEIQIAMHAQFFG